MNYVIVIFTKIGTYFAYINENQMRKSGDLDDQGFEEGFDYR
jgi:hypothetical protein